jgi:hypothetical protein
MYQLRPGRHDAASYSTVKIESLAQCCFALLARTCVNKNSGADSVMGCVISHDEHDTAGCETGYKGLLRLTGFSFAHAPNL